MQRFHRSTYVSSLRSISYSSEEVASNDETYPRNPNYLGAFYVRMLADDVANSIMPSGRHYPFQVAVEPEDPRIERLIANALSGASHRGDWGVEPLADCLVEFMHDCAFTIMAFGEAAYELTYLTEPKAKSPTAFELRLIHPRTLGYHGRQPIQRIPLSVARLRKVSEIIKLEAENVLIFRPPPYVRASFGAMLAALATPQIAVHFALFQQSIEEGSQRVPYEVTTHAKTEHLAVAEATRQIGWNARRAFEGNIDEYYQLDRQLRFEQFKIELRDVILNTVNEGIARTFRHLNFTAHLRTSGLLSLHDVQSARESLEKGSAPFKSILAPFLRY